MMDLAEANGMFIDAKVLQRELGIPVALVSAKKNKGVEELKALMKDKVTMFSGHSGVGKSTLVKLDLADQSQF